LWIREIGSLEGESCLALESGVVPPHSLRADLQTVLRVFSKWPGIHTLDQKKAASGEGRG
jgi:hypothetical protein